MKGRYILKNSFEKSNDFNTLNYEENQLFLSLFKLSLNKSCGNIRMENKRSLSELHRGQMGVIHSIADNIISLKLLEMGCIPGEEVKVENIAPFGDPIAVTVSGYKLSLRK